MSKNISKGISSNRKTNKARKEALEKARRSIDEVHWPSARIDSRMDEKQIKTAISAGFQYESLTNVFKDPAGGLLYRSPGTMAVVRAYARIYKCDINTSAQLFRTAKRFVLLINLGYKIPSVAYPEVSNMLDLFMSLPEFNPYIRRYFGPSF